MHKATECQSVRESPVNQRFHVTAIRESSKKKKEKENNSKNKNKTKKQKNKWNDHFFLMAIVEFLIITIDIYVFQKLTTQNPLIPQNK